MDFPIIILLISAALSLVVGLSIDGILPRVPLERLANFPIKGAPGTNGAIFGIIFILLCIICYKYGEMTATL